MKSPVANPRNGRYPTPPRGSGKLLADRLGLDLPNREGHDLKGPCIAPGCGSSDAFGVHQDSGVAHCYSCLVGWSPFELAVATLALRYEDAGTPKSKRAIRNEAEALLVDLGMFEPRRNGRTAKLDPLEAVARAKGISRKGLLYYGAKVVRGKVHVPMYGPDGEQCSHFIMDPQKPDDTGLNAKGKTSGIFLPVDEDLEPGETVAVVEGVKDAVALSDLDYWAFGLPGNRLRPEFVERFRDLDAVIVPDRDQGGEEGAMDTAAVLYGVARSVRIATLPAKFKRSKGDDVRDILKQKDGEAKLIAALDNAREIGPDDFPGGDDEGGGGPTGGKGVGEPPASEKKEKLDKPVKTISLEECRAVFQKWLHLLDTDIVDVVLAAVAGNRLEGDPLWLLLVGPPGDGKTELLRALSEHDEIFTISSLTPQTLISGLKPEPGRKD